jgi:hypothetical protein
MVARLLNRCGLELGAEADLLPPAVDNPEGFWEHHEFLRINEGLLATFGRHWHSPVLHGPGWVADPGTAPWLADARELADRLSMTEPWGWKDPRNTVHLPFWREVFPSVKILVCVRDPLEVAQSLHDRDGFTYYVGFRLWALYHDILLKDTRPAERVVTHYDAYFHNPAAELRRLRDYLFLPLKNATIDRAAATIRPGLRHLRAGGADLVQVVPPAGVCEKYAILCAEAGQGGANEAPSPDRGRYLDTVRHAIRMEAENEERVDEMRRAEELHAAEITRLRTELAARAGEVEHRDRVIEALRAKLSWRRHRVADQLAEAASRVRRPLAKHG